VLRAAGDPVAQLGEFSSKPATGRADCAGFIAFISTTQRGFGQGRHHRPGVRFTRLDRIEKLVLRTMRAVYFRLPTFEPEPDIGIASESDNGRQPRPTTAQPQAAQLRQILPDEMRRR